MGKKKFKTEVAAPAAGATERTEKKAAVTGGGQSGGGKSTLVALGVMVVAVAVVAAVLFGGGGSPFTAVQAEAGVVRLPLGDVNDGKAHHYSYEGATKTINFFVMRSSDGVIRAAFDACDVCFREKKGYRQEGDVMVCNNCGQRFPSTKISVLKGGCNPAPRTRQVEGQYLVLRATDIEQGAFYF
jgi:uncharacterized membrane protein